MRNNIRKECTFFPALGFGRLVFPIARSIHGIAKAHEMSTDSSARQSQPTSSDPGAEPDSAQHTSQPTLKPAVHKELLTLQLRVQPLFVAERLWERSLTDEDRQKLGGNPLEAYQRLGGTVGIWATLRGISTMRALIEVGREVGFLKPQTQQWLLREIGEAPESNVEPERPSWHPETGELRWGAQVIRKVRVMATRSSIQLVLDTFQAAGWPSRIDDPISQGKEADQVRQIVLSLNEGLAIIRFHDQESGRAITWSRP
jgi:hypothetical protein